MRAVFSDTDRNRIFLELEARNFKLDDIAKSLGVSRRTVTDWKSGKYTIQAKCVDTLLDMSGMNVSKIRPKILEDWWNNSNAGKKGSAVTISRHGPPGTPESRLLGGQRSYALRRDGDNDIFTPKKVRLPRKDNSLSEFMGILIGDGNITKYQVSIFLSSLVDVEYSLFVVELFEKLFGFRPNLVKKKNANCLAITGSSLQVVNFLVSNGLPLGDKLKQNLDIPRWILENSSYTKFCLRGIFDTDGSIYQEKHKINGKIYSYPRMAFVSFSPYLRNTICISLKDMGMKPKIRGERSVNLENFEDINKYFKLVGTSNLKHRRRFSDFGGVG